MDPQIGVLRLDSKNGETLAVVYNFACHPIQGVPSGGNTADITGFASKVIEDNLSDGAVALFLQGCAGDINPVFYKDVSRPRDAEPLGNMLGLSTLKAARQIQSREAARLQVLNETHRAAAGRFHRTHRCAEGRADAVAPVAARNEPQPEDVPFLVRQVQRLRRVSLLRLPHLLARQDDRAETIGSSWMPRTGENMEQYIGNIHVMEELTRVQENLALLDMHQAQNAAAGKKTLDVEVLGLRVGDFVLVTFPGELTVQIGLNIKKRSPHEKTFVAGYTNGYIYYAPTDEQLRNRRLCPGGLRLSVGPRMADAV